MVGVLSHVAIGLLSALLVYLIHKRRDFSLAIFIGNLFPDIIQFGLLAVEQMFSSAKPFYQTILNYVSVPVYWFGSITFLLATVLLFYDVRQVNKKRTRDYADLLLFFLVGVILHLIMDHAILEHGPWI